MTDERNDNYQQTYTDQGANSDPAAGATRDQDGRRSYTEEFRVSGESVLAKIKELVHEGNVRRITIKNDDGRTLIEIPLTLGVIGTVLLPVWAAIGAIAAMAANLTIAVQRSEDEPRTNGTTPSTPPTPPSSTPDQGA
ncbi:MAG TPA: DUF4342 domain-containing protein [Trueperaceae bacterium]|nr:DUF4342 domain-containing protein [Trueperaceae bacterium]